MTYRVIIEPRAYRDLDKAYERAARHAPQAAYRWLNRFEVALATLAESPERRPLAPENSLVEPDVRQFIFGKRRAKYRALFTIDEGSVHVLHIRWGGMTLASKEDLLG